MTGSVKAIVVILIILVLGGGVYVAMHKNGSTAVNPNANTSTTPSSSSTNAVNQDSSTSSTKAAATITFTSSGFSPSITTVKVGDTVQVINNSSQPLQFDSDPHPQHTDEPELNVGDINPGENKTFVVTKRGHWGFHDHLNAGFIGTLDVH